MQDPDVVALILNWETPEEVISCVDDLQAQSYSNLYPIIIDNGSRDDSARKLNENLNFPVLTLDTNQGFARGMNKGVEFAAQYNPKYIWLLNPDITIPNSDILKILVSGIEANDNYGLVSPLIENKNQNWFEKGIVDFATGEVHHTTIKDESKRYVENGYVPFTAALIDQTIYEKLGGLPEEYFLYYEDVDFCTQTILDKNSIMTDTNTTIIHDVTESSKQHGCSPTKAYYRTRNHILFVNKYDNYISKYRIPFARRLLYETAIYFSKLNVRCFLATIKGLKDGMKGVSGKGPYP